MKAAFLLNRTHHPAAPIGALRVTLPAVAGATLRTGFLVDFGGRLATCHAEVARCVQHRNAPPNRTILKRIKGPHPVHRFHADRLLGARCGKSRRVPKRPGAFNIVYTEAVVTRYPWCNALSNFIRGDGDPRRSCRDDHVPQSAAFSCP